MSSGDRLTIVVLGTLVVHFVFAVLLAITERPEPPVEPPPRVEMVDIDVVRPEPDPDPEPEPDPDPEPEQAAVAPPEPQPVTPPPTRARPTPQPPRAAPPVEPPPGTPTDPRAGGAPVLQLDNLTPGGTGPPVSVGTRQPGRGKGGSGGGTGTGTGAGDAPGAAPPAPVSVAAIKTRAKPKGDHGYLNLKKDYPEAARRLGIEGQIKVRLNIDDRGKVTRATLITRLGHGLDELALDRARTIEFEPARDTSDRAVASVEVWTFTFTLPD